MKTWKDLVLESYGVEFAPNKINFQKVIMLPRINFDRANSTVFIHGKPITSAKTISQLNSKLDKIDENIFGAIFPERIEPKTIINRISKLTKYEFVSIHQMMNDGFEYPYYWISLKRK